MFDPNPQLFSAEVRPAMDENRPVVGPNLAENEELAKDVAQYISTEFFYPYWLEMERLFPIWNRVDSMWRCTVNYGDLDVGMVQRQSGANDNQAQAGGFGMQNTMRPWQAKVSPAAAHKQIDAITTLGCAISWEDGDVPIQFRKPKTVFENPAYNPVEQSVRVANELARQQIDEIGMKAKYRIGFGNFVKYGFSVALRDLHRKLETIECRHRLPQDVRFVNAALMQLRNYYKYPESGYDKDEMGNAIVIFRKTIPVMRTNYYPLDVSSTFIDDLLPCTPMERQPCPIVKMFINRWELQDNEYDPVGNPFGWVNIDKALDENSNQYVLSQPEEQELRARLLKRWGANSVPGNIKPQNTIQSLWTAYALLAIDPKTNKLDRGQGIPCEACGGQGNITKADFDGSMKSSPCPTCKGKGKIRLKAQRYVVQMYGSLYTGGGVTVLRIQRNPTAKDKVPILFAAHLTEDTATARPVSKSEIALSTYEQLATAHNQFLDSKSRTINRPWFKRVDSLAYNVNCNAPNVTIPFESNPDMEAKRVESNNYDETDTLLPYMQMEDGEIVQIFGANDTVLGEISAGRRAASEITLANEGSKRPLIQQVDQFNEGHMGGWGQAMLDDIEAWSDGDEMIRRTGSTTWGKMQIHTAVGEDLLSAQNAIGQYRYILEGMNADPAMQGNPVKLKVWGKMFEAMRVDISLDDLDQGSRKAQQDAFVIMSALLKDGNPAAVQPNPDDPDQIYLGVFKGCFDEIMQAHQTGQPNHWLEKVPRNVPLLGERINRQTQQMQFKQMQAQQQQLQQQFLEAKVQAEADPRANQPERPGKPAKTPGEARQKTGA